MNSAYQARETVSRNAPVLANKTMSTNAPVLVHFILISNLLIFQYGWKVEFIRWGIKR